jgi:hypothetical protein
VRIFAWFAWGCELSINGCMGFFLREEDGVPGLVGRFELGMDVIKFEKTLTLRDRDDIPGRKLVFFKGKTQSLVVTNHATVKAVDVQPLILQTDPRRRTIIPRKKEVRIQWLTDIKIDQNPYKA